MTIIKTRRGQVVHQENDTRHIDSQYIPFLLHQHRQNKHRKAVLTIGIQQEQFFVRIEFHSI